MKKKKAIVTRAVSFPMPRLAPVTITTFPVWSGTFSTVQLGWGGTSWLKIPIRLSDMTQEYINEETSEGRSWWGKLLRERHDNYGDFLVRTVARI